MRIHECGIPQIVGNDEVSVGQLISVTQAGLEGDTGGLAAVQLSLDPKRLPSSVPWNCDPSCGSVTGCCALNISGVEIITPSLTVAKDRGFGE